MAKNKEPKLDDVPAEIDTTSAETVAEMASDTTEDSQRDPVEVPTLETPIPDNIPTDRKMYEPPPIVGYRPLTQDELDLMNAIKSEGEKLALLIASIESFGNQHGQSIDPRMLAIGKTNLQTGMMFLTRAVAKPTGF